MFCSTSLTARFEVPMTAPTRSGVKRFFASEMTSAIWETAWLIISSFLQGPEPDGVKGTFTLPRGTFTPPGR